MRQPIDTDTDTDTDADADATGTGTGTGTDAGSPGGALLASFVTGHFGELRQSWWHGRPSSGGITEAEPDALPPERRGLLAAYDLEDRRWLWQVDCDSPAGFTAVNGRIFVASMHGGRIFVFDEMFDEIGTIANRLMNDLHTIVPVGDRLLVTSSGTDAILEIDHRARVTWSWWATEHGYPETPAGATRNLDHNDDFRMRDIGTSAQTTHLNSAVPYRSPDGRDCMLTTLFHQGELVEIDRLTGDIKILVDGMDRPHSPRRRSGGWMLSCSGTDSVVLLDDGFWIDEVVTGNFNWVQDAIELDAGHLLIADANHSRLAMWSTASREVVDEIGYDPQWKVYQIDQVPRDWVLSVAQGDHTAPAPGAPAEAAT